MPRHYLIQISCLAAILLALAPAAPALADAAPPQPPPGTGIESGYEATKVQMVSENVLITVLDDHASVEATFQLRNQGTETESFRVRFPLGADDGWFQIKEISGFEAYVDGALVQTETENQEFTHPGCTGCPIEILPWATWPVTFPPGQTISVGVTYLLSPQATGTSGEVLYKYILETGAGWYGPIGEGTITARLPYPIDKYTLRNEWVNPNYYTISGTDVVWHFTDLEPTQDDNIYLGTMSPIPWRAWQSAEAAVAADPDSVDAHITLARALSDAVYIERHGIVIDGEANQELYQRAIAEFQRVIAQRPDDLDLRRDYLALAEATPTDFSDNRALLCPALQAIIPLETDAKRKRDAQVSWDFQCIDWSPESVASTATLVPTPTSAPTVTTVQPTAAATIEPTLIPDTAPPTETSPLPVILVIGGAILAAAIGAYLYFRAKSGAH